MSTRHSRIFATLKALYPERSKLDLLSELIIRGSYICEPSSQNPAEVQMSVPLDSHYFSGPLMFCDNCKRSMQEIVDKQLFCKKQHCSECSLLRTVGGNPPRCEEWSENIKRGA